MSNKVYILMGTTGETDDITSWFVAAYFSEENADTRKHFLNARLHELGVKMDEVRVPLWDEEGKHAIKEMRSLDPMFTLGINGVLYYVDEVVIAEGER